jgi:hypothetical protein
MFTESSINETHISQYLARLCDSLLPKRVGQLAVLVPSEERPGHVHQRDREPCQSLLLRRP